MDAVQFVKERNRMCEKYFVKGCRGCPLENIQGCSYLYLMKKKEKDIVSVVENWSEKNPIKTVLQDFLEKYPNAILTNGRVDFCPLLFGYSKFDFCINCKNSDSPSWFFCSYDECWNSPVE